MTSIRYKGMEISHSGPAPYVLETFPIGVAIVDALGFNGLNFAEKPGAKFIPHSCAADAADICRLLNEAAA